MAKRSVRAVVFDLDGTLYLGGNPLLGAPEAVRRIAQRCPVWYLTNNTSRTPEQYQLRLKGMGFPVENGHVISPLLSVVAQVHHEGIRHLWAMANSSVYSWLDHHLGNVDLHAPIDDTELVLLTYDDTVTYASLCEATWRLQRPGVKYWVTHPDKVCPSTPGPVPDVGSLVELFACATGKRPEKVLGKPDPRLLSLVTAHQDYAASDILFVGDRLYTDYALAQAAGCQFALTLSGETRRGDLEALSEPPSVVVNGVGELEEHFEFAV